MNPVKCICIVDDNKPVRDSMVALSRAYGYSANAYASAEELLGERQWDHYDCLVVDFNMPGMNGLQLLSTLQQWGVNIPVLVLSGHVSENEVDQLKSAGAAEIIHKPFNAGQLMKRVASLMSESVVCGGLT